MAARNAVSRGLLTIGMVALLAGFAAMALPGKALAEGEGLVASQANIVAQGDTIATATPVALNAATSGALASSSSEEWYKVTLPSAGEFQIQFSGDYATSGNWEVSLRNAADEVIWDGRYYLNNTQPKVICTTGLPAGSYYIRVDNGWDSAGFRYTFTPLFKSSATWESEFNDTIVTADPVSLNKVYYGNLQTSDDEDWFKAVLPKAGRFQIKFGGDYATSGSWDVSLYNAANEEIWSGRYYADNTKTKAICTTGLPAGDYYIRVDNNWDVGGLTYHLDPAFKASALWETEFNDTIVTADSIAPGKNAYGNLQTSGDEDWYKVFILAETSLRINFKGTYATSGSWNVSLYDAANNELWSGSYSATSKTQRTMLTMRLKRGAYYIRVDNDWDVAGLNYTLKPSYFVYGTTISKVAKAKKGFTARWYKVSDVSKYQVRYSRYRSMKSATVLDVSKSRASKKVTKLSAKKRYYVQVRAVKKIGNSYYYSAWSNKMSVVTKR